jgi:hypothetical protein
LRCRTAHSPLLTHYARHGGHLEAIAFGIVSQCGASSIVLGLPISQRVDMKALEREHPDLARLWNLSSEITRQAFGPKDIFHDRSEEEDLVLQRAGEKLVPELISGRYDAGLTAAVNGFAETPRSASFRSLLANYRGPTLAADPGGTYVPRLLNPGAYQFSRFVAPEYPPPAINLRIEDKVELLLTLEPATGEVLDAHAVSGNLLLKSSAVDAAKQWRFKPESIDGETLNVTLQYALRCP